ncbi:MAG: TspO/MBR family protein [bacterium]
MKLFLRILFWIFVSYLACAVGLVGTAVGLGPWYSSLAKPSFTPPNWLFGPVWSTLYTLMGISMGLMDYVSEKSGDTVANRRVRNIFLIQIALNALWPLVFFGAGWLWLGLVVIVLLEVAILAWIALGWPIHRLATAMILPYPCWVGFATCLNGAIAWLNR